MCMSFWFAPPFASWDITWVRKKRDLLMCWVSFIRSFLVELPVMIGCLTYGDWLSWTPIFSQPARSTKSNWDSLTLVSFSWYLMLLIRIRKIVCDREDIWFMTVWAYCLLDSPLFNLHIISSSVITVSWIAPLILNPFELSSMIVKCSCNCSTGFSRSYTVSL